MGIIPTFRIALYSTVALLPMTALGVQTAHAQTAPRQYSIESQDLGSALRALGVQSGADVVFDPALVSGKRSGRVSGKHSAEDALRAMLRGTGLSFKRTASGGFAIAVPFGGNGVQATSSVGDARATAQSGEPSAPESTADIVVTGTAIRGIAPVGANLRTVDSEAIRRSGYTTTEQLLQALPENFRGGAAGASADQTFSSGSNAGYNTNRGSGVNLRGLGNNATLVLVNGHRVVPTALGYFTDISTIPLLSIDRIEVLTDGASAIYGSDAIAGVVNIILRQHNTGVETSTRYGMATEGGTSTFGSTLQAGTSWDSGWASLGVDYTQQSDLSTAERDITAALLRPNSIFPAQRQWSAIGNFRQDVGNHFALFGDGEYASTHREYFYTGSATNSNQYHADIQRWTVNVGGAFHFSTSGELSYTFSSGSGDESNAIYRLTGSSPASLYSLTTDRPSFSEHRVAFGDALFDLPGGPVKLAIGATFRREEDRNSSQNPPAAPGEHDPRRTVKAVYGEIALPIIGDTSNIPLIHKLTASFALRYSDYSDFGGTTNPKVGLSWFPTKALELRGAYSTSFRAPAVGNELTASQIGTTGVFIASFLPATGSGNIPVVYLLGGKPGLQPEKAKNFTVGAIYKPPFLNGVRISLNYYRISYTNQLSSIPFSNAILRNPAFAPVVTQLSNAQVQTLVSGYIQNGVPLFNGTGGAFGSDPVSQATYVIDGRTQNLSSLTTSGFDLDAQATTKLGEVTLNTDLAVTYITHLSTRLTPAAPEFDITNTVGNPARLRARLSQTATYANLSGTLTGNITNGYSDTSSPLLNSIPAYLTVDAVLSYVLPEGIGGLLRKTRLSISASNLFDRHPPYINSGSIFFTGVHYDSANANPMGRYVTLSLTKAW
ncbi:MAG: TonB-dependent receptor [Bradyrhizobium sp.]|nr:TonB-dependent receptor [Bradyrhizobium sp.]